MPAPQRPQPRSALGRALLLAAAARGAEPLGPPDGTGGTRPLPPSPDADLAPTAAAPTATRAASRGPASPGGDPARRPAPVAWSPLHPLRRWPRPCLRPGCGSAPSTFAPEDAPIGAVSRQRGRSGRGPCTARRLGCLDESRRPGVARGGEQKRVKERIDTWRREGLAAHGGGRRRRLLQGVPARTAGRWGLRPGGAGQARSDPTAAQRWINGWLDALAEADPSRDPPSSGNGCLPGTCRIWAARIDEPAAGTSWDRWRCSPGSPRRSCSACGGHRPDGRPPASCSAPTAPLPRPSWSPRAATRHSTPTCWSTPGWRWLPSHRRQRARSRTSPGRHAQRVDLLPCRAGCGVFLLRVYWAPSSPARGALGTEAVVGVGARSALPAPPGSSSPPARARSRAGRSPSASGDPPATCRPRSGELHRVRHPEIAHVRVGTRGSPRRPDRSGGWPAGSPRPARSTGSGARTSSWCRGRRTSGRPGGCRRRPRTTRPPTPAPAPAPAPASLLATSRTSPAAGARLAEVHALVGGGAENLVSSST